MDKAEQKRLRKLEEKIKPGQKAEEKQDLSVLSVEELKELEVFIIKRDNGQEWTEREERRIGEIMSKVK